MTRPTKPTAPVLVFICLAASAPACSESQPASQGAEGGAAAGGSSYSTEAGRSAHAGFSGTSDAPASGGGAAGAASSMGGTTGDAGTSGAGGAGIQAKGNAAVVANLPGLIAFWDFAHTEDGVWTSYYDPAATDRSYPVHLRQIGDPVSYRPEEWPHTDAASQLIVGNEGPFESSVRFNRGYVFGEVSRAALDGTPLDISGRQPFTLVAWMKFTGQRHMVAGIWDEGAWDPYGGQRQFALFGGLFGSQGITAHISSTGAASYPQSKVPGAQYARLKALDGQDFENEKWVSMAMIYDPIQQEVSAYLDGKLTPRNYTDPVIKDVFELTGPEVVNPAAFEWPIFSPRAFILKFNGYSLASTGVAEHWLHIESEQHRATYGRNAPDANAVTQAFRVRLDLVRAKQSLLAAPLEWNATAGQSASWPDSVVLQVGDEVVVSLLASNGGPFASVGSEVRHVIYAGAPLTFGRAMGLGSEELKHGSELQLGGVAVFNRPLTSAELTTLSF